MNKTRLQHTCLQSADKLEGYITATGTHDVQVFRKQPGQPEKLVDTIEGTSYSFIDTYERKFELFYRDLQVRILEHATLRLDDGTYIDGKDRKALVIHGGGGKATVRLQSEPSESNSFADFVDAEFPPEGMRVRIDDQDAYIWQDSESKPRIDYSPATFGWSDD